MQADRARAALIAEKSHLQTGPANHRRKDRKLASKAETAWTFLFMYKKTVPPTMVRWHSSSIFDTDSMCSSITGSCAASYSTATVQLPTELIRVAVFNHRLCSGKDATSWLACNMVYLISILHGDRLLICECGANDVSYRLTAVVKGVQGLFKRLWRSTNIRNTSTSVM